MYFIMGLGDITVKTLSDNSPAYGPEEKKWNIKRLLEQTM